MFWRRKTEEETRTLAGDLPTTLGAPFLSPTAALQIADVWSCVRVLSDAAASLPLHVYRRTDAGRERVENRTADLLRNPAPSSTTADLIGGLIAHLNLTGDAFVGKFFDENGRAYQLALLPPERIRIEVHGGLEFYVYTDGAGQTNTYTSADIIHIRALSLDGVHGLSPIAQARATIGLSKTLTSHAEWFFHNNASPGGILKFPERLDRAKARDIVKVWSETHGGTRNAGLPAVLTGGAEWQGVAMNSDDAQFLEQRKLSSTEVARIFNVPPHRIGAESGSTMTYANVETEALDFVRYSLLPWLVRIESALSADADLFSSRTYCAFTVDALLRADSQTRAEFYARALDPNLGWMTRAEVRALEDLEPEPDRAPTAPITTNNGQGATA